MDSESRERLVSLDDRDVRRGMDVYTLDDVYLGSVVRVESGPARSSASEATPTEASAVSGESLGPMPTATIGNRGPTEQSAGRAYATGGSSVGRPLGAGRFRVRRWLAGLDPATLIPRSRWIPLELVQTVSLERVILRVTSAELNKLLL